MFKYEIKRRNLKYKKQKYRGTYTINICGPTIL